MKEFSVKNHEPSYLPDGDWTLVWADEFDGDTLDTTKWDFRLHMMGRRHPAWTDQGVRIENSCAVLPIQIEDGRPVSVQLQTGYNFMDAPALPNKSGKKHLQWNIGRLQRSKFTHRYGYFECRCRLQQLPGWWTAFWVQSPMIGASLDPAMSGSEIDIMESFRPGMIAPHCVITGGYGHDLQNIKVGGMPIDEKEFHRFGVLWNEIGYTFYVDGVEDGHVDCFISHIPEFILISSEPNGYRTVECLPTAAAIAAAEAGDDFLVDYVRVFDLQA